MRPGEDAIVRVSRRKVRALIYTINVARRRSGWQANRMQTHKVNEQATIDESTRQE